MNGVHRLTRLAMCPLLALAVTSVPAPSIRAQEASVATEAALAPAAQKIVKGINIVFNGTQTIDEARVRSQMSVREGEPYTNERVEQDIRNLYATGTIEDVQFSASDVAGGVSVTVIITGRGAIGEIAFLGNTSFDNDKLLKESEIKIGDSVDDARLSAAQQKIRDLYQKRGYGDVLVSYETGAAQKAGFTAVTFKIDEGARGVIHDIRFEGNTVVKESKLRSKLKSKERKFWSLWGKSWKLDNEALQEDIKTVEGAFHNEGYVYAKVLEVRREPVGADKVDLVFVINQGEKYDVAEVSMEGLSVFTQEELTNGIKAEAGFPYSGADVTDDERMIQQYYGSRGYADARVDTSILDAGPGLVKIVYRITEGSKSFVRKVNIAGNSVTQDRVIRRELPFAPGDELNTVKVDAGRDRLQNLNYFSQVDIRPNPTGMEGYKDIDINVTEQPTGSVNFGAGFSSIDSLVGFIDLTQTNFDIGDWPHFRGAGQRFNMNLRYGLKRRDFRMSFTEPFFMGQRLAFTTELFYRDLYFLSDRFDQSEVGGSVGLRKPMGEHSYLEGTLTAQNITIDGIDENASQIIQDEAGDFFQTKIDVSWVHDTRDSIFITRSGHKIELGGTYSGLGGDVDVFGLNFAGAQYITLPGDTILSLEGAIRTIDATSGDTVPIFERLFLGGANNLRGFDYREVGPKDETGEPIGGRTSAYFTVEYTFPIIEKVRGAVFYDVGAVSGDAYDVGGGDVNSNVGVGLRLFLPVGPIRVDFGVPVQSDEFNDSGGRFQFNLGYKF